MNISRFETEPMPTMIPGESNFSFIVRPHDDSIPTTSQKVIQFVKQTFYFVKDLLYWLFGHSPCLGIENRNNYAFRIATDKDHRITYLFFSWITGFEYSPYQSDEDVDDDQRSECSYNSSDLDQNATEGRTDYASGTWDGHSFADLDIAETLNQSPSTSELPKNGGLTA